MNAEEPRCAAKIVVVDDDPTMRTLIAAALADEGFDAVPVADGADALRIVRREKPDAVTLDLEMPGVDGRTVLRQIRRRGSENPVAVVVVSASCDALTATDRELGFSEVTKPFELSELLMAVSDALAAQRHGAGR